MKKVLFIDRDGTIIKEPPTDLQIDSLEKLEFVPGAIGALRSLVGLGYELVMASNQDGLGTASFPEETFWPAHDKMIATLAGEGFVFDDQLIDKSMPEDKKDTRKPGVGMFGKYLNGGYDLANSYVIGDRISDMKLARNLGTKGILIKPREEGREAARREGLDAVTALVTQDWAEIAELIRLGERTATVERRTSETDIKITLDLDGRLPSKVETGLGFFDHMLMQIVHHAGVSLQVAVSGDLRVDEHHTIEDTAIVLGEAFLKALGNKVGIGRYGFALPMDECSALVLIDFGGRIDFEWDVEFRREKVGDVPTEMFKHFFKSFASGARCNLHISAKGENEHHKIEGIFKAFARALRMAVRREPFAWSLPSSKGVL